MSSDRHLAKAAAAAWAAYDSAVRTGGTAEQRRWAFERANHAEDKLAEYDNAQRARAETEELPAFPGRSV